METTERWRTTWREGIDPQLSNKSLSALRAALLMDDPRLLQGETTHPPPCLAFKKLPVQGACALGYCGWIGECLDTVEKVHDFFIDTCLNIEKRLNEGAMGEAFLAWFDETPRDEMRLRLLTEVERSLRLRGAK